MKLILISSCIIDTLWITIVINKKYENIKHFVCLISFSYFFYIKYLNNFVGIFMYIYNSHALFV